MSSVVRIGAAPHLVQIGWYAGEGTGMRCMRHFRGKAQPLTLADLSYEGYSKDRPDLWCEKCAKYRGRKEGHEYVCQPADGGGFEVIDLTYPNGLVAFWSSSYAQCVSWVG
jgi:hypothetical protein